MLPAEFLGELILFYFHSYLFTFFLYSLKSIKPNGMQATEMRTYLMIILSTKNKSKAATAHNMNNNKKMYGSFITKAPKTFLEIQICKIR